MISDDYQVSLRGTVIIIANHGERIDIPAGEPHSFFRFDLPAGGIN